MNSSLDHKKIAVIGLGISNISVIRYLIKHDLDKLTIYDTRDNPPNVDLLPGGIDLHLGPLNAEELKTFDMIVISPGISIYNEIIEEVAKSGIEIVGDIELFARECKAPVVAITGSNGKSTVTSLMGYIADKAGIKVAVGANIGVPVFDILSDDVELYVLELSSFELETTESLKIKAGVILNVSEDHLDRYHGSIEEYAATKKKIFKNCEHVIVNVDDARTYPDNPKDYKISSFGVKKADYSISNTSRGSFLNVRGRNIVNAKDMRIYGEHNQLNALACMALSDAVGIPKDAQERALKTFAGLPHRCQLVKVINEVSYYNDSKATNVASTEAALRGLRCIHKNGIILLGGGLGKGQDFTPLKKYIGKEVTDVYAFGKDAQKLLDLSDTRCHSVINMRAGLNEAFRIAKPGQAVLLSPACASFDQFKGFEDRGQIFVNMVANLTEPEKEKNSETAATEDKKSKKASKKA